MSTNTDNHMYLEKLVRAAKVAAVECETLSASAVARATLRMTKHMDTAGITKNGIVYFGYDYVRDLLQWHGPKKCVLMLGWTWIHEVEHYLRDHALRWERLQGKPLPPKVPDNETTQKALRSSYLWNIAADLEINDGKFHRLLLPLDNNNQFIGYAPKQFGFKEGLLAEEYFYLLLAHKDLPKLLQAGEQTHGEGSGVDGQITQWEKKDQEENGVPKDTISPAEKESIQKSYAKDIVRDKGNVPGNQLCWARDFLKPYVNWRTLLQRVLSRLTYNNTTHKYDYSWSRPHRRSHTLQPFILPQIQGISYSNIMTIVDVSGSMQYPEIQQCITEVGHLLIQCTPPIRFVTYDTRVTLDKLVYNQQQLKELKFEGGGGTSMDKAVMWAVSQRPTAVFVLTDGETDYPSCKFDIPVFWVILQRSKRLSLPTTPWCETDYLVIEIM